VSDHLLPGTEVWCEICYGVLGVPAHLLAMAAAAALFHVEDECPELSDLREA
jgi:hypothetical protein